MDATVANLRARIDLTAEQPFDVGSARIDPVSREAILPNSKERLQPQNLKVLIALKRRSGNVVTRDELVELCWNARFVADDVINRSISTLRRFAQRAGGFEIETIPRCGYRLVEGSTDSKNSRIGRMALAVGIIAAIGTASWLTGPGNSTAASQLVSILPLTAQADDVPAPEVATAAGDAIASALTDDGYSVRRPGSFEKHPAYIVEGNVIRTGNDLQATIRVEKRSGSLLLSSLQFGAPIQQAGTLGPQIGAQVAESLSLSSALESVESHHAIDPAMMTQLIEQTNFLAIGADPMPVFAIAQRLSRRAPNSAIAQLLLATSTGLALGDLPPSDRDGALRDGRYAANRALALAPNFGTSYIPWCLLHSQVRMEECETQLRTGLRVDPSAPFVSQYMSELLSGVGRSNEALQSARVGFADNPHMPTDIARLLRSLDAAGQPDVAERLYTQARLWWPKNRLFFWSRAGGMLEWGDFDHLEEFEAEPANVEEVRGYETPALFMALRAGNLNQAKRQCRETPDPSIRIVLCMLGLARLGDLDDAYRVADKLYPRLVGRDPHEEDLLWLRQWEGPPYPYLTGVAARPMRRDPRYLDLAERVGLLAYWRSGRLPDFCTVAHEPICGAIAHGHV